MAVAVRLLGPVEAEVDGRVVPLSRSHRLLLARLAMTAGAVSTDALRELLGGEDTPVTVSTVKSQISRLRAALGGGDRIRSVAAGYALSLAQGSVDVDRFEQLVKSAAGAPPAVIARRLADALGLWRGPVFGDLAGEPFAVLEASRLDELRLQAIESRASAMLLLGRYEEVAVELERLTLTEPLRERLHCQLAAALAAGGRQADALRALDRFRRMHRDETGLDPSPALVELERRILAGDAVASPAPARAERAHPRPLTPLIGRAEEIEHVVNAVYERRMVALVGLGGIGKTRIALGVAAAAAESFGSGVVHLDMARSVDDDAVPAFIADAFGQPVGAADELASLLADTHALLIVDGCEHALSSVRRVLASLLAAAPRVHVLATSRVVLGMPGELVVRVGGLPVADAASLLAARAGDVGVSVAADDPSVLALCEALDRIPLAIELAAGRLTHLSPAELLESIDRRFELLRADVEGRHASLLALLDDAVGALADHDRALLDAGGTFMGAFPADAAAWVAGTEDVGDSLARLVAHSLVVATPGRPTSFRLLDTVRAHARDRATASEATRLGRHAAWYLEQATAVSEATAALSIEHAESLRRSQPDIELALRTLLERGDRLGAARLLKGTAALWRNGSGAHFDVARTALEQVLADDLPPDVAIACHGLASFIARMQVDDVGSGSHAQAGTEIGGPSGWHPWCWGALGLHLVVRGAAAGSEEMLNSARHAATEARRRIGDVDPAWHLPVAWDIANVAFTLGDIDDAHTALAGALGAAVGGRGDLITEQLLVRACDATALHILGRDQDAYEVARTAVEFARRRPANGGWLANQPMAFIAPALAASGEVAHAMAIVLETLPTASQVATILNVSDFVVSLAAVRGVEEDWEAAAMLLGASRALGVRHSIPFRTPMGYALYRHWNQRLRLAVDSDRAKRWRERGASLGLDGILAVVEGRATASS